MNNDTLIRVNDALKNRLSEELIVSYQLTNFVPNVWNADNSFVVYYIATKGTEYAHFSLIVDVFQSQPMLRHNFFHIPFGSNLLKDIQNDVNSAIYYLNNS